MTDDRLADCREPPTDPIEAAGPDERALFAVAYRNGLYQETGREIEWEANAVLYLTRDGQHVTERWITGTADDLSDVDRAFVARTADLQLADEHARRYATIVRRHPEV